MDRQLINALVVGGIAFYFTRDPMATMAVGGASYLLTKF
jgi:hypothetical protein